ncbi:hypothetical protein MMC30_007630 [Trapelia coarctata]|nr:hypothetical protein [Trapelia coarctata]
MECSDDLVVAVDFGMTGTAVAWCTAASPTNLERLRWKIYSGYNGNKQPTVLAYPKARERILSGVDALQSRLLGERYCVVEWFKLHLDFEYIKAAQLHHDIFTDHTEIEKYYTDFLKGIYASTRQEINKRFTSAASDSWEKLRIRFEFTWPSNWSDVTKQHYIDCIRKAGFGTCAGHRVLTTYDEATAAVEYASGLTQFGAGETVLICDVGGATTDLCMVKAVIHSDSLHFELVETFKSICLGGTEIDANFQSHVTSHLTKLGLQNFQQVAQELRDSDLWLRLKAEFSSSATKQTYTLVYKDWTVVLTRQDIISIIHPPVIKLRDELINVVGKYGKRVNSFVGCGGCFYMLYLRELLQEWISKAGSQHVLLDGTRLVIAPEPECAASHGVLRWRKSPAFFHSLGFMLTDCERVGSSQLRWDDRHGVEHHAKSAALLVKQSSAPPQSFQHRFQCSVKPKYLYITLVTRNEERLDQDQEAAGHSEGRRLAQPAENHICQLRCKVDRKWPFGGSKKVEGRIMCTLGDNHIRLSLELQGKHVFVERCGADIAAPVYPVSLAPIQIAILNPGNVVTVAPKR